MTAEIFQVRERALEYEFFHKVDEELWRKLRAKLESDERRKALAEATGITDEDVLAELVELKISSETVFALSLFPLVWAAWAGGRIDEAQRHAILEAAHATGHERDTASHHLIETWLDHEPPEKLQTAWKDYVHAICQNISPAARRSLRQDVLARAQKVAEAVVPRYGFHEVEDGQETVLRKIKRAFDVG